ncbi:MAG: sugar phosphate isomerase/epimerase [Thaumarchaeota archaeon]|jgi:sugar phosphate isomerase/epimerase|nr:sugar phosphate isomerase/epimerase [Nitrososphaerota archaeon]
MYVAVRDFTVIWVGYEDLVKGLKDLGLDRYEMYVNKTLTQNTYEDMDHVIKLGFNLRDADERRQFLDFSKKTGLKPCTILLENDFSNENLEEELDYIRKATQLADEIGVEIIRINSHMQIREEKPVEEYAKHFVEIMKRLLKETEGSRVAYAVENHGYVSNDERFLDYAFKEIDDERVGITLDTGNFYWYGYPLSKVHELIEKYAKLVKHTHLKNLKYPEAKREKQRRPGEDYPQVGVPLYEGDVDLKRVVQVLRKAGYAGDLTIEDESLGKYVGEERKAVLKKDVEFVRKIISET